MERNAEYVHEAHDSIRHRINEMMERSLGALATQLRSKLLVVMERKNRLSAETRRLESVLVNIENQVQSYSRSTLVRRSDELVGMFTEVGVAVRTCCKDITVGVCCGDRHSPPSLFSAG